MQELLKIHPHIPSVPRKKAIVEAKVAEAEGHDETETKQDANQNTLRSFVEGAVSAVKVPVLMALASMYFHAVISRLNHLRLYISSAHYQRTREKMHPKNAMA